MIDASAQTIRAVADAMQLAALMDDRTGHSDDARVAAWSEQIERHKLTKADLLDGVQAFYDNPSDRAIQVGDLIHHARKVRRDRNEREAEAERERRAEVLSVKASDETRAFCSGRKPDCRSFACSCARASTVYHPHSRCRALSRPSYWPYLFGGR